jgi:signal transduction histidine kinase
MPLKPVQLWPVFLLLLGEALALGGFAANPGMRPPILATPFSALVAALILFCGLLPALLRPSLETLLAGCLATVMAGILITPIEVEALPAELFHAPLAQVVPAYLVLRLVNGTCLGPLLFHLLGRFPRRSLLSTLVMAGVYAASLGLLLVFLLVNVKAIRLTAFVGIVVVVLGLVVAAVMLLFRSSQDISPKNFRAAQQARLLFISLLLAEMPALLRPLGLFFRVEFIPYNLFLAAQILVPLGIAYAVLRHDLFDIDRALRRGLAYATLSILLLAVYFGLTVALTALLTSTWPELRGLVTLISLFAAALAFEPLRQRVQYGIDRALYPDRLNFQHAIAAAQQALERVVDRQEVVRLLTEDLPPRLGADWASLSLPPAPETPGRTDGTPAWNAQLMVAGKSLGRYWLGSRRVGPSYDRDEQAQLQSLAGQAALALAYADTIEALSELNRELEGRVAERTAQVLDQQRSLAALEERQCLARDLHDSITQALFSINLSARALRGLVRRDLPAAVAGLGELEESAQQALAEMRALLAQLRSTQPPGIGAALQPSQAEEPPQATEDLILSLTHHCEGLRREAGSDGLPPLLDVRLEAPQTLFLPAFLARHAFNVIKEALHNVVKHSGAAQAVCRVECDDQWLKLAVIDQGGGFDPQTIPVTSFGLRGMQERLQVIGGRLEIYSSPASGTSVQARIPISQVTHEPTLLKPAIENPPADR